MTTPAHHLMYVEQWIKVFVEQNAPPSIRQEVELLHAAKMSDQEYAAYVVRSTESAIRASKWKYK